MNEIHIIYFEYSTSRILWGCGCECFDIHKYPTIVQEQVKYMIQFFAIGESDVKNYVEYFRIWLEIWSFGWKMD